MGKRYLHSHGCFGPLSLCEPPETQDLIGGGQEAVFVAFHISLGGRIETGRLSYLV